MVLSSRYLGELAMRFEMNKQYTPPVPCAECGRPNHMAHSPTCSEECAHTYMLRQAFWPTNRSLMFDPRFYVEVFHD